MGDPDQAQDRVAWAEDQGYLECDLDNLVWAKLDCHDTVVTRVRGTVGLEVAAICLGVIENGR